MKYFFKMMNLSLEAESPSQSCCPQYRLAPIPRARYDFACAGLVFLCILLVHLLVMPR